MADVVRQVGARLTSKVDPVLQKRFYPGPLSNLRRSYGAFHAFDKAHTVALLEAGLISLPDAQAILRGLRRMESEGIESVRDRMGGGRHSGEAYLTESLGADVAGWINLGRSSGDLDAVAWRYNLRNRLPTVLAEVNRLRSALLDLAARHVDTVMPAYSLGQHAQCTSLAHMLLSWEAPLARDLTRGLQVDDEAASSPSGSGIMTGSTFPISRRRTAELLGFDGVQTNTRDAVVNLDSLLHAHSVATICMSNALSIASDLYLWTMTEFKFVDLADPYCSTSSIMPQKKNSWALSWIRGQASLALGRLSGVFALLKMESDGLEDTLLGPWQFYETLDELEDMVAMLAGMISTMTVNVDRLAETASHGWTQATDLAAMLTQQAKISWREAHQVVAHLVREAVGSDLKPEELTPEHIDRVASQVLGRSLGVSRAAIRAAMDPRQSLTARNVVEGSPAPDQVRAQIQSARIALERDMKRVGAEADRQRNAAKGLDSAVDAILARNASGSGA
ncbi:MAG: argininosuccinate lyase [Alphaproteobacteria bacterium]|nr:argininosuccinate lyase [Alphaproteobacteria bacterium]